MPTLFLESYLYEPSTAAAGKSVPGVPRPGRRAPAYLARQLRQILLGVMMEALAASELTPGQWGVLVALSKEPGIDQRRLAERQCLDTNSASRLVDELEHLGMVRRQPSADDRRANELRLTPAGLKKYQRLRPAVLAAQDGVLAPLARAERQVFLDLLTRVVEGNKDYARPGNGRRKPVRTSVQGGEAAGSSNVRRTLNAPRKPEVRGRSTP